MRTSICPQTTTRRLRAVVATASMLVASIVGFSVGVAGAVEPQFIPSNLMDLPSRPSDLTDFSGATVDSRGYLWVVDNSTSQVLAYRNETSGWRVVRSFSIANIDGVEISDPESITWIDGGRFAVVDEDTNALHYLNFSTTSPQRERIVPLGDKIPIPVRNNGIEGLTYDHDASTSSLDVFYVGLEAPATLYRVEVGNGFTVKAMPLPIPEIAGLEKAPGTDRLYIISEADATIYSTTTSGARPVKVGSASEFAQPEGIALDPNGLLYVVGEAGTYKHEFATFRQPNGDDNAVAVVESSTDRSTYSLETGANDVQQVDNVLSENSRELALNAVTKIGLRVPHVCIGPGHTILDARLDLVSSRASSEPTVATIRAELTSQPVPFSQALLTSRKVTETATRWDIPATVAGSKAISPDLSQVLAEVANAPGWPGCGDIVVILQGRGDRYFQAFDAGESLSARLEVTTMPVPYFGAVMPATAPRRIGVIGLAGGHQRSPSSSFSLSPSPFGFVESSRHAPSSVISHE